LYRTNCQQDKGACENKAGEFHKLIEESGLKKNVLTSWTSKDA
jgi:hypothetical protein